MVFGARPVWLMAGVHLMINLYEAVRLNENNNRLAIGDFLFAEYTCGIGDEKVGFWADTDYLVHVVTGKKTWHTPDGICLARPGETIFFRKGAAIVEQHFEEDFCLLMFFIPDGLVRSTVREMAGRLPVRSAAHDAPLANTLRVENDTPLFAFFQSMRTYFSGLEKPSELLIQLKLKELIIGILTSDQNVELADYFRSVAERESPGVADIMEANFRYNLSLEEYARMCHRSLSSFKRDFQESFQEPPGKWLLRKRLEYSAALLRSSKLNVTEIAFESGFEDVSHFSRVFKQRFNVSPVAYRQQLPVAEWAASPRH